MSTLGQGGAASSGASSDRSSNRPLNASGTALSCLMYFIFASTFIAAKYGLQEIPPFTLGAIRTALAAVVLFALCRWRGDSFPRQPRQWLIAGGLGFFTAGAPATLGLWGVQHTQASLASVIMGTQPLLVALLAHRFLRDDRLDRRKLAGLIVGFGAVGLISFDKTGTNAEGSLLGQSAMLMNALAVAISAVFGKSLSKSWRSLPLTAVQTAGGFVFVLGAVLVFERDAPIHLSLVGVAASVYLALIPTVLGYTLWVTLIARHSASGVSAFAFMQPVFGIVVGWALFAESFTWLTVAALVPVTWSIVTVNRRLNGP